MIRKSGSLLTGIWSEMERFMKISGIASDLTVPKNPYQNGINEPLNRTVMDLVHAMTRHRRPFINTWGRKYWLQRAHPHTHYDGCVWSQDDAVRGDVWTKA